MRRRLQVLALRALGHLPRRVRIFLVHQTAPSFSVGAMCVVERDDGSRLFVRLSYRQGWGLPGGLLKRGEAPEAAAHRELEEEVGLAVELVDGPRAIVEPHPRRVDLVFRARPAPGADADRLSPRSPEILELRWVRPGEPLPPLHKEAERALREIT